MTHEIDYAIKRLEESADRTAGMRRYPGTEIKEGFASPDAVSAQGNAVDYAERRIAFPGKNWKFDLYQA